MPRSHFEQLIDAGLARRQQAPPRPRDVGFSPTVWPATKQAQESDFIQHQPDAEPDSLPPKPHMSGHELRRAYRDWQTIYAGLEDESGVAAEPESNVTTPALQEPGLSELLDRLANHKQMTRAQLQALRRQLARRLHPDLVSESDRQSATAEMARLNAIVDAALRTHRRP